MSVSPLNDGEPNERSALAVETLIKSPVPQAVTVEPASPSLSGDAHQTGAVPLAKVAAPVSPSPMDGAPEPPHVPGQRHPWGHWTRWRIIDALQADALNRGAPPTIRHWDKASPEHPTKWTVQRAFGSWNQALEAAGLTTRVQGCEPIWSRESISQAIYVAHHKLGRVPTSKDIRWLCGRFPGQFPDTATITTHFGSWTEALRANGYPPHHNTRRRKPMQNCPRCRRKHWGFQKCELSEVAA